MDPEGYLSLTVALLFLPVLCVAPTEWSSEHIFIPGVYRYGFWVITPTPTEERLVQGPRGSGMDPIASSKLQFGIMTTYHFFFVPLTYGLSILVALKETMYLRTDDEAYKRMTKFWGKLFLINFVMENVTSIGLEFQFGMN
jgi:hypothetical protein